MIDFDYCEACNSDKVKSYPVATHKAISWRSACESCGVEVEIGVENKKA